MVAEIAIVGMACRYPQASSPAQLWENVLSQRRAFRRIPPERLRLEDYFSSDRSVPDTTYSSQGAFLENYEFDRVHFCISGPSYRSADLVHWLALDIASQALIDAGFVSNEHLPLATTGVLVGNTLTGEFSRANGLRLRWPYVRRVVEASLRQEGWSAEHLQAFLDQLEATYKEPFAPVGEETLAGGLSNTIAGRICNYFNFKGGGYTLDGACSSSLLAIANACSALVNGDIDLALAGGVDLSLDPFELIGFAKTSALAQDEMRIFDAHSTGFLPGEGCGFVVLMRYEDAIAQQRRIYGLVRGWGISSDGAGGITRPEVEGQTLALTRAYHRAGISCESIAYFEGHGTGTSVGDTTELQTLSRLRRRSRVAVPPAVIGSIKANIGHTKAASGVAGFIKATQAVFTQILPPTTGTHDPHSELTGEDAVLQVLETGKLWPPEIPLRAGVSSMGFGGINVHLIVEGINQHRRAALTAKEQRLFSSAQDAELIMLSGHSTTDLQQQIDHLLTIAPRLALAELTDMAIYLAQIHRGGHIRAAIVASNPGELTQRLEKLRMLLVRSVTKHLDQQAGIFLGMGDTVPRIGFLFPGQGAPAYLNGGLLRRRFNFVDDLYNLIKLPSNADGTDTQIAQPAIITSSLAALHLLQKLGITASLGVGHSLGELTALHWAGGMDEGTLIRLASIRGQAMSRLGSPTGAMVSIRATKEQVETLLDGENVVIAGLNAPQQTVISGDVDAVATVVERARAQKIASVSLAVSHAFHSPLVAAAVQPFAERLAYEQFQPLQRSIISTVTGKTLAADTDITALLCQQITSPVEFMTAVSLAARDLDLFIEVGPGKILSGLADQCTSLPALAMDAGGNSIKGLLSIVGAVFAMGLTVQDDMLFAERFHRPFDLNWQPHFLVNPCELAPLPHAQVKFLQKTASDSDASSLRTIPEIAVPPHQTNTVVTKDFIKQLVAQRAELPVEAIKSESRMLSDLHLNSITVGQIVSEACRTFSLLPPVAPMEYADASIDEITQALEDLEKTGSTVELEEQMRTPAGVDTWIRTFKVVQVEQPLLFAQLHTGAGQWDIVTPIDYPYKDELQQKLALVEGNGIVVCLPPLPQEQHIALLLHGAQKVLSRDSATHFVLIQHGGGGSGFARTLYLEAPRKTVCVIDLPFEHSQTVEWVLQEIQAAKGYTETIYGTNGERRVPRLELISSAEEEHRAVALGPDDVLLVTGGGKGIAAECALSLAQETGVRLLLLGRSKSTDDHELAENLQRMSEAGISFQYLSADVADGEAIKEAIHQAEDELGQVTAILHGAGTNVPKLISALSDADVMHTLTPKVQGLKNVLAAVEPARLKLLVTFGSVIARTGMRGEADYALANDWLASLTENFQSAHPACRCLCIEWSVWSGVGMGERLGRIEALMREGISPIPADQGIALLHRLLEFPVPDVRVVVTSRFGESPTLQLAKTDLPLLRFLEQQRVYYPQVELVVEAELSTATDPYLEDHKYHGERLLPAVVGLEAMVQAAMAVTEQNEIPSFENIQLYRPIVVPEKAATTIRIAALVRETGKVDVVIRCQDTAFQVNHFSATCCFDGHYHNEKNMLAQAPDLPMITEHTVDLDPIQDLYGGVLFHQGRFQRVQRYRLLLAKECVADISPYEGKNWYMPFLPADLTLGDPAARDAVIHSIQACIPHATLLPIGVREITLSSAYLHSTQTRFVSAKERQRQGDVFHYDVEVRTAAGEVLEKWIDLRLQQVEKLTGQKTWRSALLGPYMERKINDFFEDSTSLQLVLQRLPDLERHAKSERALHELLHSLQPIHRRSDGKPLVIDRDSLALTTAHAGEFTFAATHAGSIGCDIEFISSKSASLWHDLLGNERYHLASLLVSQADEDLDSVATRIWTASESLKKAGAMVNAPLLLHASPEDNWCLFTTGSFVIATYKTVLQETGDAAILAVCLMQHSASGSMNGS